MVAVLPWSGFLAKTRIPGGAGNQPMGPWCYVDAKACKYPPLNDTTGLSYGWCENNQSRTTYDTGALPRERGACRA